MLGPRLVQDLDLEKIPTEHWPARIGRVHGPLPARDRTQRQLREDRDVDQTWIVPLDQDDVRVEAPQAVDDEALQRADVLDLLNREDVETIEAIREATRTVSCGSLPFTKRPMKVRSR